MSTSKKPAPRLARPAARYWKGKAPKGAGEIDDSDSEDEQQQDKNEDVDVPIGGDADHDDYDDDDDDDHEHGHDVTRKNKPLPSRAAVPPPIAKHPGARTLNLALKDVNISTDGKVIVAGRLESGRTALERSEEESSDEEEIKPHAESSGSESTSEEEEDEEEPKVLFRPKFIPKRGRITIAERDARERDTEEALKRKEQEAEERRKQSHNMVADSIKRELAEKQMDEEIPDVDDTDGLDPDGEFEAWRLRELARIKRDKEEELQRELEREEIERRRELPEEQRLKEDLARAKKTRDEKPKGQQKFLQKFWHKGAFHQDEEILTRHDYTQATESTIDVSVLPQVMQVKNFGKRGRTKYTHLVDQDTTVGTGGFGGVKPMPPKTDGLTNPNSGCFNCGGPHLKKDCLQPKESGSNGVPLGARNFPGRDGDVHSHWKKREHRSRTPSPGARLQYRRNDDSRPRDQRRSRERSEHSETKRRRTEY